MLRIRVCPTVFLCRRGSVLFGAAIACLILLSALPASRADSAAVASAKGDEVAVNAMRNVVVQSGGLAAWQQIRSAKETFSVLTPGQKAPQIISLLDDWSLESARYRRREQGQSAPVGDHNGSPTYAVDLGGSHVTAPELDQARVLLNKLPAAAAEVMLRRQEYVLKISTPQPCEIGYICVNVFRTRNSTVPLIPEQQWKIASATGLPVSIRYYVPNLGIGPGQLWKEVRYLQYGTEGGVVLPTSIMTKFGGTIQAWTLVSFKSNPGFDTAKFDREDAQ